MKRSSIYYLAQRAVITDESIAVDARIEVLRELMSAESLAKLVEEREKETDEAVS